MSFTMKSMHDHKMEYQREYHELQRQYTSVQLRSKVEELNRKYGFGANYDFLYPIDIEDTFTVIDVYDGTDHYKNIFGNVKRRKILRIHLASSTVSSHYGSITAVTKDLRWGCLNKGTNIRVKGKGKSGNSYDENTYVIEASQITICSPES